MDKRDLMQSASHLQKVDEKALAEYTNKSALLTSKVNELMLARPDMELLIGKDNAAMMMDNHANHARFMVSVFKNPNHEVLVETILWVFRAYRSHGFKSNYWAAQLNAWLLIMKEDLSEDGFEQVYPFYEWMLVNIPLFTMVSEIGDLGINPYTDE